jgi:hypothetical protein
MPLFTANLLAKDQQSTTWTVWRMQQRFGADERVSDCLAKLSKKQSTDDFLKAFIALSKKSGIERIGGFSVHQAEAVVLAELKSALIGFSAPHPLSALINTGKERIFVHSQRFDVLGIALEYGKFPSPYYSFTNSFLNYTSAVVLQQPYGLVQQTRAP